jgi:hypothetical protein
MAMNEIETAIILLYMIPAAALAFIIHLILHEVGHFLGGLLTGWKLINLQIYHFALVRDKDRVRFRYLPAVNYQCIMYPKSLETGAILYTIGGYLMNLFIGLIGLLLLFITKKLLIWSYAWCFFGIGLVFYLINGAANTRRICNDKACYLLIKKSENTKVCHNAQLMIAHSLNEGKTYQRIGEELICQDNERAYNDIEAYQAILEYYFHLESNNFIMMRKALDKMRGNAAYCKEVADILALEQLYMELILRLEGIAAEPIDEGKYDCNISNYISEHGFSGDVHTARIKAVYKAYECVRLGNTSEAVILLNRAAWEIKNMKCLYEGEKIFCIRQVDRLINMIRVNRSLVKGNESY